ncbi:MAG: Gfo/Idh/MocA family protein [Acidimicrobiales bacterium]
MTTVSSTFGFVGLGFAASALHLPALRSVPGARLIGGVDPDPARRRAWSSLDAGPSFATLDELLTHERPDVVVVAAPPAFHAEMCIRALDAGADVLCEKPFVETSAQAEEVLLAATRAGRRIAVNHEFRYMPIFSAVADAIGGPRTGRAVFVSCVQFMDLAPWDEPVPWRAAMPQRSLFEAGVHLIDLMHLVTGRLPESVSAHTSAGISGDRTADAIHLVTLDYGDGVLAQITIDRLCKAGTRYVDLQVDCEHESLRASYGGRALVRVGLKRGERAGLQVEFGFEGLAWAQRGMRRRVLGRNPRHSTARATGALYRDTLEAWRNGTDPPSSGRAAADTLRIVEAAYRSAASGERLDPRPVSPTTAAADPPA